jgi:hypothetical protein
MYLIFKVFLLKTYRYTLTLSNITVLYNRSLPLHVIGQKLNTCGEPAISHDSHHVSLVQWTNLFASRHKGPRFKSPGGYLCETGILLLALSRYIGDPGVIDHHGLVWGGLCPEPSLGHRADNVIIPLDLTQLSCPGFTLAAGLPSGFTTDKSRLLGGSPVESLQSHMILTMSHWSSGLTCLLPVTRDPGSNPLGGTYVKPGFSC